MVGRGIFPDAIGSLRSRSARSVAVSMTIFFLARAVSRRNEAHWNLGSSIHYLADESRVFLSAEGREFLPSRPSRPFPSPRQRTSEPGNTSILGANGKSRFLDVVTNHFVGLTSPATWKLEFSVVLGGEKGAKQGRREGSERMPNAFILGLLLNRCLLQHLRSAGHAPISANFRGGWLDPELQGAPRRRHGSLHHRDTLLEWSSSFPRFSHSSPHEAFRPGPQQNEYSTETNLNGVNPAITEPLEIQSTTADGVIENAERRATKDSRKLRDQSFKIYRELSSFLLKSQITHKRKEPLNFSYFLYL
ncbi:hypothetical protein VNO77_18746 [Canavalia gladiata]|uniref:Uncharacterized protein n=1 Tax=Canavalia gladiata TaxID=3824 RepID=A0AAN9LLH6_CANGL